MRFLSLCSGIEAASCAWIPLGWECVGMAEIESFPCEVLKHHYPNVPNYGDITRFKEWPLQRGTVDLIIGGTPCQSFSVAGLRKGLADPRGNLALTFLGVVERFAPTWVVWENVPGVFSSWSDAENRGSTKASCDTGENARRLAREAGFDPITASSFRFFDEVDQSNDLDCFLAGLRELGYGCALASLDAQHFGLAQRRERVFVVGHIGGQWQRAAAVLFDRESLSGNPPPSRETRQGAAHDLAPCVGASGRGFERTGETRGQDPVVAIPINMQAAAKNGTKSPNMVGIGNDGDPAHTVNASDQHAVACTLRSGSTNPASHNKASGLEENLVAYSLRADGFDASEDGTGRGTPLVTAPITHNPYGDHESRESLLVPEIVPQAMSSKWAKGSSGPSGDEVANMVTMAFHQNQRGEITTNETAGSLNKGGGKPGQGYPAVAFTQNQAGDVLTGSDAAAVSTNSNATGRNTAKVQTGMAVRRLTPTECERLQGFPDGWTAIPWRGKTAEECPDGPRYRSLGNSMAVPVIRWIGKRIQEIHNLA